MELFLANAKWMMENVLLGMIAVVFGWTFLKTKSSYQRAIFAFLWLLFIPNTIYMLTDIIHIPRQLALVEGIGKIFLISQYAILILAAFVTFVLGLYPIERMLVKKYKNETGRVWNILFVINFVIAFGMVIGRVQRTNSWEVFTNLAKVIQDGINIIKSQELIFLVFFFGILNNLIYFLLRRLVKQNEIA